MLPQRKQYGISKLGKRDNVDLLYQVVPLTTKNAMCWLRFIQFNSMVGWRMEGACLMILRNNTYHLPPSEGWICWIWIKYSDILPGKIKDFLLNVCKLWVFFLNLITCSDFHRKKRSMSVTYKSQHHPISSPCLKAECYQCQLATSHLNFFFCNDDWKLFWLKFPKFFSWGQTFNKSPARAEQNVKTFSQKKFKLYDKKF